MRKLRSLILIIILIFIQFTFLIASPPDDGEGLTHFPSPDSLGGVGARSVNWNFTDNNNTVFFLHIDGIVLNDDSVLKHWNFTNENYAMVPRIFSVRTYDNRRA